MTGFLASHEGGHGPARAAVPWALLFAFLLPLLGCGTDEPEPVQAEAEDSPASQPDRPLVPADRVIVDEAFRLEPAARAASDLDRPVDLAYDVGGNLYVLDGATPNRILKYDPDRAFLYPFSRHEPDVNRIGRASSFGLAPWNTLLLVDRANNQVVSFLATGTFVSAIDIRGIGMDVQPMSSFSEFYLQKWDAERRRAYVVHMRAPVDSLGTAYSIGIPPGQPVRKEARDVAFRIAVDRQDRLYVGFADGYPVRVVTSDGETVRLMGVDRPPVGKTEAVIEAERERNRAEVEERLPDIDDSLKAEAAEPWPLLPMIEELAVDRAGRLWVRTNRPDTPEGSTAYDVFNAAGDFLAVVRVPGEVRGTAFAPDGTLVVIEGPPDSGGEIVGYRVDLGAGEARPDDGAEAGAEPGGPAAPDTAAAAGS